MNARGLTLSWCLGIATFAGCTSPTREEGPDYRFGLYSTEHRYSHLTGEPLVLWEREDGGRFLITLGTLRCYEDEGLRDEVVFAWELEEPDGGRLVGNAGDWEMGEVRCDLIGATGLRFTIESTGEAVVSADVHQIGQCLEFSMRLPTGEAWARGSPWHQSPPLPEGLVFPDPMPEASFFGPLFCE